ncbi:single-stranded DNA-binding protein [Nocardioides guangzhouensis]|uniref:Single-stranded DNA-binding protein n=1 Tax=Nocardioides guangzhouensis TaxID=2497878 RepID=A0A4V1XZA0_9ACTN|nr:single-stranded DNA-binding protein [Nocardioides guangzhouensis]RYP86019.1 single-stranded DNA-binding protein [Nocardioides guangzhouensis]
MTVTNEVCLQGRLSRDPEEKVLPSGDAVWVLRIVVPREEGDRKGVDWIDCAVWGGRLRRSVAAWGSGDVVEVQGALRRRFYRVAGSATSRVEVEARSGRLIRRADPA